MRQRGAIALPILASAGWHGSPRLVGPDNLVLLPLPPSAPERNSRENIREYLRTGSATASRTLMRRSSTPVAMPGMPGWPNPRSSQLEPRLGTDQDLGRLV